MKTLITQTLLRDWLYCYDCAEGFEEDALAAFMLTLKREPKEQNEDMKKGILFEDGVYALAKDPQSMAAHPDWVGVSRAIANIIRGGQIQVKVQRDIRVGNDDYLLYGICDAVRAGTIYDVKFSTKSFNSAEVAGKYLDSPQHPAYLYCLPDALRFTYLVSDGKSLYTETYTRKDTPPVGGIINQFRQDIRARGLEGIYLDKWRTA